MDKSRRRASKLMLLLSGIPFVTGFSSGGLVFQSKEWKGVFGELLDGNPGLHHLGRHYFERGCACDKLVDRLLLKLQERSIFPNQEQSPTRAFCDLVDRDFSNGDVLNIDGWILSKTEVALGLVAFLSGYSAGFQHELEN